jgi:hypothetical protein
MPGAGRGGRYHHGDLRAALIAAAVDAVEAFGTGTDFR